MVKVILRVTGCLVLLVMFGSVYVSLLLLTAFPTGASHAGISSEGDNAVLMNKVAKEFLAAVNAKKVSISPVPKSACISVTSIQDAQKLFHARESALVLQVEFLGHELCGLPVKILITTISITSSHIQ